MRSPGRSHAATQMGKEVQGGTSKVSTSIETKKKSVGFEWQFVDALYGGYVHWKCKYCHAQKSGGAPRIREHFLGSATKSMRRCQSSHVEQIAIRIKEYYLDKNRKAGVQINLRENMKSTVVENDNASQSARASCNVTPNISASRSDNEDFGSCKNTGIPFMSRTRQTSLHESFSATLLEEAQLALAKAVYFSGSAMSIVDNAHWKHAWKKIGEFGSSFMPPSYHVMRHGMLDKCTDIVKERVNRVVLNNLSTTACTIVSDG